MGHHLDRYRPTRSEVRKFYASTEWRAARGAAIHRAGQRCEGCGAKRRLEGHHRVPLYVSWAGRLDLRNLKVLCADCHRSHKKQENAQWRRM